jgi:hypothetical protein
LVENTPSEPGRGRTKIFLKTVGYTILFFGIIFSVWTGLKYLQYPSLQGLLRESTQLGLSNFQIEIASAGLVGLLATVFVQRRRRTKKKKLRPLKMTPMVFGTEKNVHPLMKTQRPARDTNFAIRKTRNSGRISRNRMGERLPPSYISQPRLEESP